MFHRSRPRGTLASGPVQEVSGKLTRPLQERRRENELHPPATRGAEPLQGMAGSEGEGGRPPPRGHREGPDGFLGNGGGVEGPEMEKGHPRGLGTTPATEPLGHRVPPKTLAPRDMGQVEDPLETAVEVVGDVVEEKMRHGVVVVQTQGVAAGDPGGQSPGKESLHVQAVPPLLDQVPVDLEVDADRTRAVQGNVVAAPGPSGPSVAAGDLPTGPVQGPEGRTDGGRMEEQVDIVQRPLVEAAVEPVQRVGPLEQHRPDPLGGEEVQGFLEASQQEEVVGGHFPAEDGQPPDGRFADPRFRPGLHETGVDPRVDVGFAGNGSEPRRVRTGHAAEAPGLGEVPAGDGEEDSDLVQVIHE